VPRKRAVLKSPCVQVLGDALLAAGEKKAARKAWRASLSRCHINNMLRHLECRQF
jgi:predicted negative regulator of RcsB-dependent stress response